MSTRRSRVPRSGDERGAVIPFVAICLVLIVVSAALAVDIGRVSVAGRETRNVADLAALDSVKFLTGASTASQRPTIEAEVAKSAARNGFVAGPDGTLTTTLGTYDRTLKVFTPTAGPVPPNAVRVQAKHPNDNLFAPGSFTVDRTATAMADGTGLAGIGIATTTAAVDSTQSAVLNALLSDVLGGSVNLTAP